MKKEKEGDIFQDIPIEDRTKAIKDNSYKSEEQTINRPYSTEQLTTFKDQLSEQMIALNEYEVALKKIKDDYKAKMKPYELEKKKLLKALKLKHEESFEEVYLMDDQELGIMCIYDAKGKFLHSRKLYPDERQKKMFTLENTGTND